MILLLGRSTRALLNKPPGDSQWGCSATGNRERFHAGFKLFGAGLRGSPEVGSPQFDGNPQGMRILTRLQGRTKEERRQYGMDLTYSQILTALKYPRGPLDAPNWKKAGLFESERSKVESAWTKLGFQVQQRFPLAYPVEAADDISYCIGDMEDGIDQGVFTPKQFFDGIEPWTEKKNPSPDLAQLRETARASRSEVAKPSDEIAHPSDDARDKDCFATFKTEFTGAMIKEAVRHYGNGGAEDIRNGTRPELLANSDANDLLGNLKDTAGRFLYPADKLQRPFVAGLKVTRGILDEYSRFLTLPREQFALVRKAWKSADRRAVSEAQLETLLPLLDALPSHYLDVYDSMQDHPPSAPDWGAENWEWFCRAHLVVDYLSGMTDDFATGRTNLFREPGLSSLLIVQSHPRLLVDRTVACHGGELIFTYSRYEVAPPGFQAAAPRSAALRVRACDVTPNWLDDRLAELGPTEELAWHSSVECKGAGFHIPMIDFISRPARTVLRGLDRIVAAEIGLDGQFVFFETGRSFHGYLPDLIPEHAWPKYLGRLLLLN